MSSTPSIAPPRFLYLHGFASGPKSHKGVTIAEHFARRGVTVERLDLRVPSLEHLRVSAGVRAVKAAIGGPRDRVVLFGSSLGGLTASRVAEDDARVAALVLLAPAFRLIERWRQRLGEAAWRAWEQDDALAIDDFAEKKRTTVDYGFIRDLEAVDGAITSRGEVRVGDLSGWPDVRVPTLLIHGRADATVDVESSRIWSKGKRHVHFIEVDDGHELAASLPRIIEEAEAFLTPFVGR